MNDESAFLAAIRAAPGDLTVRGGYADWLEERDDPRAGFVRNWIALVEATARFREQAPRLDPEWVQALGNPCIARNRALNRIEAVRAPSKFVPESHLAIAIDGIPLDVALGQEGLVSSLLGWFHDDADCAIPWQRILPEVGCTGYAPVLICSDDLDLCCSVVTAEVVSEPDIVRWDKLGFEASPPGAVGACVRWEPNWGPYHFDRAEYEACLAAFGPPVA